jgi:citrate synthase
MARVDQRGFDNQPAYVDSAEASALLGVKRATLYAYVSRGLVRSLQPADGGPHRYAREDLLRLRARHDARAGHAPVAAAALRWGEPVLESSLTDLGGGGPRYRGYEVTELAARGVPFESVAELLWRDAPLDATLAWPEPLPLDGIARLVPRGTPPLFALAAIVPILALRDADRFQLQPEAELDRARALVRSLAAALALGREPKRLAAALAAPTIAEAAALALGARGGRAVRALEQVLVLSADHELNASSFTARVAASAGADLYACVGAAFGTMTGPRHGGAADRVEALVAEARDPRRASSVIISRLRRGEALPGFGHPLYPAGDPRARRLIALARTLPGTRASRTLLACVAAVARGGGEPPTLDAGLVAVASALGLPAGSASGLFALGRTAGWIAHALEQRAQGFLLRPRARYVGRDRAALTS